MTNLPPRIMIVESPYRGIDLGDRKLNEHYLNLCLRDAVISYGDAPFASHAIYTRPGVLDEDNPEERKLGIELGFAWWEHVRTVAFYVDRGWTVGMKHARSRALGYNKNVEERRIDLKARIEFDAMCTEAGYRMGAYDTYHGLQHGE